MFLLIGIHSKVKDCGAVAGGICLACGQRGALHITNKYMTPHIFFIPTFAFRSEYFATCAACASVMALTPEKGRALQRGRQVNILREDLQLLQNNACPHCPRCSARQAPGSAFCNRCGAAL